MHMSKKLKEKKHNMRLRNRITIEYNSIANPNANKLIQLLKKPRVSEHVGEALNGKIRTHWI